MAASLAGRGFAVLGGGVVGLSLARELRGRGADVVLIEAREVGGGASGAAAGLLPAPRGGRSLLQRLARGAHAGYEPFLRELTGETGMAIEFRRCGLMELALDAAEEGELRKRLAAMSDAGAAAAWVGRRALSSFAPGLDAAVRGGLHVPETAWIHPPDLIRALRASAELRGVQILEGRKASLVRGPGGRGFEAETRGPGGERMAGREVLVAAGAWSGEVLETAGLAPAAPIIPVRGQMVEIAHPTPLGTILHHRGISVIPRPGGTIWVGATVEEVGFDERVEKEGLEGLIDAARAFLPDAGEVRRSWAGLRPKLLRRGGPLLGEGDPPVVAGHYRSGIHLGPITAHLVASRIAGDTIPVLTPFEITPEEISPLRH